ncbi:MAG: hypothetical protein QOD72_3999, partial [Acidimicrobiaceae bacterium]|nr:hypothetical protein [Acidimicrobiaceae bacterium]
MTRAAHVGNDDATLAGMVWPPAWTSWNRMGTFAPALKLLRGGGKMAATPKPTTYATETDRLFPARSTAVHVSDRAPARVVSTVAQDDDVRPDTGSVAFGFAVAVLPTSSGLGEIVGASVGAVVSTFTTRDADAVLPATSVHEPLMTTAGPTPDDVDVAGHCAGSRPEPDPSDQFHVTVTALLFHPLALAAGDSVGDATGAVVS